MSGMPGISGTSGTSGTSGSPPVSQSSQSSQKSQPSQKSQNSHSPLPAPLCHRPFPSRRTMTAQFQIAGTELQQGVTLIEASAGTGKTYTIAGIFLRLILEQRH